MTTKKIPIDKASAAQLAQFAQLNLGLDIGSGMSANEIRALLENASYAKDHIEIEDVPAKAQASSRGSYGATAGTATAKTPTAVKVTIHSEKGVGGDRPIFVGVNFVGMTIPRGETVEIPYSYYEALKNAVGQEYESDEQSGLSRPRDVPAYPFSVHEMIY